MSRIVSVSLLAIATALVAACQQLPAGRAGQADTQPATQVAAAPPPAPVLGAPATQASTVPVVEFRLAQPESAAGLQPLKVGDRQLWVLPQPVLTRADLQTVAPVKSREGISYVRFQFTQAAAPRLAQVTQRFPGKFLLLSIDGQLASAPTIGGAMNEGVLFMPVLTEQQAAQVVAAVAGPQAPAANPPGRPPAR
jgi:preprotein translocase subunit SecD